MVGLAPNVAKPKSLKQSPHFEEFHPIEMAFWCFFHDPIRIAHMLLPRSIRGSLFPSISILPHGSWALRLAIRKVAFVSPALAINLTFPPLRKLGRISPSLQL